MSIHYARLDYDVLLNLQLRHNGHKTSVIIAHMKIVIVTEVFAPTHGGVPVAIEKLAGELTRRKHDVIVLTTRSPNGHPHADDYPFRVRRVRSLAMPFDREFQFSVLAGTHVRRTLDNFMPDIIHVHTPWGFLHVDSVRWARHHNVPVMATNHIMDQNGLALLGKLGFAANYVVHKIWMINAKRLAQCDHVVAQSAAAKRQLDGLHVPITVISNGLDTRYYAPVVTGAQPRYFVSVGRLSSEKQVDIVLRALAIAVRRDSTIRLVIAGRGRERARLETLAQELGITNNVTFVGYVSDDEKRRLLSGAVAYINACAAELQCIAALEALACGTSVIVSDQAATPELVNYAKNGFTFCWPDATDLAEKMITLWQHPIERSTLQRYGREWVVKHPDMRSVGKRYDELITSLTTQAK